MIKSLELRNFQRHKKLKVKLAPGITTIVGSSDKGKSAIIRSLKWLARNKPNGSGFIHHDAKTAAVRLKTSRCKVVRRKGEAGNSYSLDGRKLKSFGSNVPTVVEQALALADVNFQGQHDNPYWFSLSAGQVSKELNAIVNLSLIDTSLKSAATIHRKAVDKKDVAREAYQTSKTVARDCKYVQQAAKDLELVQIAQRRWLQLKSEADGLEDIVRRLAEAGKPVLVKLPGPEDFQPLGRLHTKAREAKEQASDLQTLVLQIKSAAREVKATRKLVAKTEHEFQHQTKGELCPICQRKM
jgi:exonuclease SbcC